MLYLYKLLNNQWVISNHCYLMDQCMTHNNRFVVLFRLPLLKYKEYLQNEDNFDLALALFCPIIYTYIYVVEIMRFRIKNSQDAEWGPDELLDHNTDDNIFQTGGDVDDAIKYLADLDRVYSSQIRPRWDMLLHCQDQWSKPAECQEKPSKTKVVIYCNLYCRNNPRFGKRSYLPEKRMVVSGVMSGEIQRRLEMLKKLATLIKME